MTTPEERLEALEEFAAITGHGLNVPWLDLQIVRAVRTASENPDKREVMLQTALLLQEGKARLVAQQEAAPPTAAPTPVNELEILRRNTILMERFDREVNISKSYTTVVTGAGYAGLLAIWSGLRDHVDKYSLLYSAALIAVSLVVFIVWEMVKSGQSQRASVVLEQVVQEKFFTSEFEVAAGAAQARHIAETRSVNRFQPLIFWLSTVTGFGAAGILIWAAVVAATGLKVSVR